MVARKVLLVAALLVAGVFPGVTGATTTINKQFAPPTIDPGDLSRLRITVFNSANVPLTAAAVTDSLPTQVAIGNPANVVDTCGFTSVTAAPGTRDLRAVGGTVPAWNGTVDGSCYLELDVTATAAGNWPNTIPANGPANGFAPGGPTPGYQALEGSTVVTNSTPATATLAVRGLSNPTGSKTFAPSPAILGEPITLSIVLSNPNTASTIPLTTVVDALPAGMTVAPVPNAAVSCTGAGASNGSVGVSPGGTNVTLSGGTIGASGSCTLTVRVVVNAITGTSQSFNNAVPANAIGNTRGLSSAGFSRSVTVATPVTLAKAFVTSVGGGAIPNPVPANSTFWARIDIGNASTSTPLLLTSLTDNLPAGLTVAAGTPVMDCSAGGGTNGTVNASVGGTAITIVGGTVGTTGGTRRCRVHVPVTAAAAGSYTNSLPANAVGNTLNAPSPAASATANVNAELRVAKSVSSGTAAPGEPVTFTVTLSNYSGGPVTGVTFTDNLPSASGQQMVVSSPNGFTTSAGCSGGTWSNAPGSAVVSWTGGVIAGGSGTSPGTCVITFRANTPPAAPVGLTFTNSLPAGAVSGTGGSGGVSNGNSVAVNVLTVAAASVSKAFAPTSIVQNGTSQLTVTLSNQTATSLTGASLTDSLPTGMVVAATPAATTTCAGGTVTAAAGAGSASIAGATIPGNGSCNFRFNVTASGTGTLINTIPAGALQNDQGSSNPSAASASLTVTSGLTATKAFSPTAVANGGVSRVTVRIANPSPLPLTNVSLTDGPMTNLAVAATPNAVTTCAGSPVITAVPGSSTVTMSGATLAAGGNCDVLFNVVTSGNPANWPNTIPANAITSAEGARNTSSVSATLGKLTSVSVGINKSFNPVSASAGQPSELRIDITNPVSSPAPVTNVSFTDTFPAGMEVYVNPGAATTCTNGIVSAVPGGTTVGMTGATIPVGASCSVFVQVTSTKALNLSNTIPVGNVTTTEGLTNSSATTATLSTLQGVGVIKSFQPRSVAVGQPARLRLILISTLDPGATTPITLTDTSFTDTLPSGMVVAPVPDVVTDCTGATVNATPGAGAIGVSGVTLPPGTRCSTFVDVVAASLGTYTNTIPKDAISTAQGYANLSPATAVLNVLNAPSVAKSFTPAAVTPGTPSTLVITVANSNPTPLTSALLVDNLPPLLVVAPVPNASTTCGGSVAALPADSKVQLTNGGIPANGSCTISVSVLSNTPNSYVNTIPAGALATAEGVTNTSPGTGTLAVIGPPAVTKAFNPATQHATLPVTLTLALGNPNSGVATLASAFTDTLPGGLVVASTPNVATTCGGTVSAAGGTITLAAGGTLPPGGCTISVDVTSATVGSYTNTVPAGALVTDLGSNGTAATAVVVFDTPPQADLAITKTDGRTTIDVGGTTTYTLTVGNAGPLAADGAIVRDPVATGVAKTGVTCAVSGGAACPSTLTVAALEGGGLVMGTFPVGGVAVYTVTASVTGNVGDLVTNIATIAAPAGLIDPNLANNTATDTNAITGLPDVSILKSHSGTFVRGQQGSFQMVVSNVGTVASGPVTVTDTLPAGLTLVSLAGTGWTCVAGTATCTRSDPLAPGASHPPITLTVAVAANAVSPLANTAVVTSPGDGNPGNDTSTDTVTLVNGADLALTKLHTGTFLRGGTGTFTLRVTNAGASPSSGVITVTDTLPAGLGATAISGAGWTCTLVPLACTTSAIVAPGASAPDIIVTVAVDPAAGSPLANTATVSGGSDTDPSNNTATDTVVIGGGVDLAIAKTHSGAFIRGQQGTFQVVVSNVGTVASGAVTVTDTLPAGMSVVSVAGTGWTCVAGTLTCTRSDALAPGAAYPPIALTVAVAGNAATPLANTVVVTTAGDVNAGNNTATDSVVIGGGVDLAIAKSHTGTFVRGQQGTFQLVVSNVGTVASGPVTVTDTLPAGLTLVSLAGTGWTCVAGTATCTRSDPLAPGAGHPPITLTVAVAANAVSPLANTAVVTSPGDGNPGNDTSTDTVTLVNGADLALTKLHTGTFLRGGTGTFTLRVANVGASSSSGLVTVTDTLPAGLTATAISGAGWACTLVPLACTTSATIAAGGFAPDIGVAVAVDLAAASPLVNAATVSGGGDTNPSNNNASDSVVIGGGVDLAIAKTHSGAFIRGRTATYTIDVRNVGATASSGTVVVTDTLPAGLDAVAMSGTGWTCVLATLACARSDALPAGQGYPPITLAVVVRNDAAGTLTNVARVSGGGDIAPGNNTSSDSANVAGTDAAAGIPTLSEWGLVLLALGLLAMGGIALRRRERR